jgi:hypothetical protein
VQEREQERQGDRQEKEKRETERPRETEIETGTETKSETDILQIREGEGTLMLTLTRDLVPVKVVSQSVCKNNESEREQTERL